MSLNRNLNVFHRFWLLLFFIVCIAISLHWNLVGKQQFFSVPSSHLLCTTDDEILVLERNQEQHDSNFIGDFNNWNNKKCALRHFTSRDVVSCLDNLHADSSRPWIHIAFIGDSRIRQQFHNLLKVR